MSNFCSYTLSGGNAHHLALLKICDFLVTGKKAVVKPGQSLNELVVKMAERAEENAQRKLREMMLPKRHRNLYKKMKHAQKTADKDMRLLAERRKAFEKFVCICLFFCTFN